MSAADKTGIATLEKLCQRILADEAVKHGSKKINELCKRIPSHLLESILESLLDRNQVTDVALNMFLVPSRTKLVMNGFCKIKNSTLKQIGYSCPNLLSLNLSDCVQLSNTVVREVLQGCPVLQDLRLDRCHRVTDAAFDVNQSPFQPLIGLLSLRTISLQGCPQLTGSIVCTLHKSCVRLKYLNISQCNQMELSAIQQIFDHNRLRHLNLSFVDEMTDDAFSNLPDYRAPLRNLSPHLLKSTENVAPDSSEATAEEVANGTHFKRMRTVSRHSSLQILHLAKSRITDKAMFKMAFFPGLKEVHLQWCSSITDAGITALVNNCPHLEVVDLKSCSITDISLGLIGRESKQLRHLDVSWCSNITDRGIQSLSSRRSTSESMGCRTSSVSIFAGRPAEDYGILLVSQVPSAAGPDSISRNIPAGPVRRIASLSSISAVAETRDVSASINISLTASSNRVTADSSSNSNDNTSDACTRNNPWINQTVSLLGSEEYNDDILPLKLETLVIVWCLQLTDAALLSLGALPKLKLVEAIGCTLVSEASTQHLTSLGIKIVM